MAKSYILKSFPKFTCYTKNTTSDVSRMSVIFTEFTYFPRDVSESHTSLHSTELQLILRYAIVYTTVVTAFIFANKSGDPGLVVGGRQSWLEEGRRPPTQVLFGKKLCNKKAVELMAQPSAG